MGDPLSERSVSRALLKIGAMTTAALIAFGGASAGALAQEPETPATSVEQTPSNQPSEPAAPSSTPDPAPSTEPAPPSTPSSEPVVPPSEPTAPPTTTPAVPSTPDTKPEEKAVPKPDEWQGGPSRPDLSVGLTFGRTEYLPGEDVDATLVVRNSGAAPAREIRLSHHVPDAWLVSGADVLGSRPSLRPAEQKVINLKLRPRYDWLDEVRFEFRATLDGVADPTPGNNGVTGHVTIRQDRGTANGVLYTDKNGNGRPDSDEFLSNNWVSVRGGAPQTDRTVLTGAGGEITFGTLPAGTYAVYDLYSPTNTFVIDPAHSRFVVEAGKHTDVRLPAVPAVDTVLGATVAFDRPSYRRDEQVGLTVTLTNRGTKPLTGVVAVCDSYSDYLTGTGPGWAALSPDGPGVALAAGETKTVAVTDVVPQNMRFTRLYASCRFGNNGRNTDGYTYAGTAGTDVKGLYGTLTGSLENAETGQAVPNAPIAVLDATTRRLLKSVKTDAKGALTVYDVPVGRVELVVAGPWKSEAPFVVDVVADQTSTARLSVVPGPQTPDLSKNSPDFEVTAKFAKDSYDVGEPLQVKVVVKHVGTGFAARVQLHSDWVPGGMEFDRSQLGELGPYPASGVVMWPGESRELTLVGQAPYTLTADGKVTLKLVAVGSMDPNQANNVAEPVADVTYPSGDLAVRLYADRNGNGTRDAGEEQGDTPVSTYGGVHADGSRDGRTDASGRVVFRDLPLGTYRVNAQFRDGWVRSAPTDVTISAGAETLAEVRGVRPLSDKLTASVRFVKREYAPTEAYEVDVAITNNTGQDLRVQALCSGPGGDGQINNNGAGWGALQYGGSGVDVLNGATARLRVSGPLPEKSQQVGYATLDCVFAPEVSDPGAARAGDEVRVPGLLGTGMVRVVRDGENGGAKTPVPGLAIAIVDKISREVVTRSITDADGMMLVRGLPVGRYHLVVQGPWRIEFRYSDPYFRVITGPIVFQTAYLVPGPEVSDPGYPLPENEVPVARTPVAAGGGGEALAKTGASVLGLGVLGALLVAFGLGASIIGRKRA